MSALVSNILWCRQNAARGGVAACLSFAAMFGSDLPAQTTAWAVVGFNGWRLRNCAPAGDHDQDGHADIWALADLNNVGNVEFLLLSGRTGQILRRFYYRKVEDLRGMTPHDTPGKYGDASDFDGDGTRDWFWCLCSGIDYVAAEVRSGRDGSLLREIRAPIPYVGSWSYAMLGGIDVDGNGSPELLISHIDRNGRRTGSILVYRRDGSLLYVIDSPQDWQYGTALAKVGDVDGDGGEDFVMCAAEATQRGAAVLVSGRTGTILHTGYGEQVGDRLDFVAAGCGDLDRDGVPDFAAGGGWGTRGVLRAFSGRTGQVLHSWAAPFGGSFGSNILGGVDADRDGVPDLVTTAEGETRNGRYYDTLYALSGRDGRVVLEYYGFNNDIRFPYSPTLVSVSGSQGFARVALRMKRLSTEEVVGRIEALDLTPAGAMVYGHGCAQHQLGSVPVRLGLSRDTDRYTRVLAGEVAPGTSCALLVGLSSSSWQGQTLPLKLGAYRWPDCELWTSVEVALLTTAGASGRDRGLAVVDLPWPLATSSLRPLHVQWLCLEATGTRMSEAGQLLLRYQ